MMPSATPPPNDAPPQSDPVNLVVRRPTGFSPSTHQILSIVLTAGILAVVFGFFGAILYIGSIASTLNMDRNPMPFAATWASYFMSLLPLFFVGVAIVTSAHLLKDSHREHARATGKAMAQALRKSRSAHAQESEDEHDGIRGEGWRRDLRDEP